MPKNVRNWIITYTIVKFYVLVACRERERENYMHTLHLNYQGISTSLMRRKASRITSFTLLSLCLLTAVVLVVAAATAGPLSNSITNAAFAQTTTVTGTETPVNTDEGPQMDTSIAGGRISYTDVSEGTSDIKYYDISTGSTHTAASSPGDQQLADISESYIAYTNYSTGAGDIWLYEISTEQLTFITPNLESDQSHPALSDQIVAWEDSRDVDRNIWIYDITTGESKSITGEGDQNTVEVNGDRVVYVDNQAGDLIKLYDASSDSTETITNVPSGYPDIDGDKITYVDHSASSDPDIAVHDLNTGETRILQMQGHQLNPHISGEWVSFEEVGSDSSQVGIWHWTAGNNPETDTFLITSAAPSQALNDIDGNRVTYTGIYSGGDVNTDIFLYEFTEEETPPPPTTTWTIEGFSAPVDMNDVVNTIRSGQAVALKFEVFDENGQELTDTAVVESLTQRKISCSTLQGESTDAIEEPLTNVGNTQLTYDQDAGQFIQHWKTPQRQPNTCWEVKLTVTDDSTPPISAYFRLR
jgi:beta propeller repeat protein